MVIKREAQLTESNERTAQAPVRRRLALRVTLALRATLALFGTLVILAALGSTPANAASGTTGKGAAQVYLVHALIGYPADVQIDGKVIARRQSPGTVIGPITVTAGRHLVTWASSGSTLVSAVFTTAAGQSLDVVAHPRAEIGAAPAVTVFANRERSITRGKSHLVVTTVAVAPASDVLLDGRVLSRNVINGQSIAVDVPGGTYFLAVKPSVLAGGDVLGQTTVEATVGSLTRVFVVGDPGAGSSRAIVQHLSLAQIGDGAPSLVRTGDAGLSTQPGLPIVSVLALSLALLFLVAWRGVAGGRRRAVVTLGLGPRGR